MRALIGIPVLNTDRQHFLDIIRSHQNRSTWNQAFVSHRKRQRGDAKLSRMSRAWKENVATLGSNKRNGDIRANGTIIDIRRIRIDARGNIQ